MDSIKIFSLIILFFAAIIGAIINQSNKNNEEGPIGKAVIGAFMAVLGVLSFAALAIMVVGFLYLLWYFVSR